MGKKLLYSLLKKTLLFSAILFGIAQVGYGQSVGDVAFTGYDGDSDGFAVVLFTSYSDGDQVQFTSEEWDGNKFEGSGGSITWEAPAGGTSPGTVLVFSGVGDVPSVNTGTIMDDTNMNLTGSGDVIYAFLGPDKDTPNTFLGAIATSSDQYDGTDGTLTNTGLTQAGNETILLTDNIDVAEFTGTRSGNTQNGYLTELNDIASNWQEENGSGDQSDLVLPFDDSSFTIVSPPTIAFTSATASGDEGNSVNLTIELVQAENVDVDVEVAFLESSSSASGSDLGGFSTQTVSFAGASTGATQDVPITLTANDGFEGTEKAVFQLQTNTDGSIITPDVLTLTINDGENPDIYINEIHADPSGTGTEGDADGDGNPGNNDDEFVEIVNNQNNDIDISNWEFYNESDLKHIFPSGTVIPANGALVLFGDDEVSPQGNFGGAVVQSSNESAALSLVNGGDTISLQDADGNEIISIDYPDASNDQSIVRTDDAVGGTFIDHSGATDSGGALFSPGTKVNGDPFGSNHAIAFRGNEGWRMVSSPVESATFNDFFADFWMQGVTGSDDPGGSGTLFSWTESGGGVFSVPANMSGNLTPGLGYIVYVFEDNEYSTPGIQGGFPKVVNSDGTENSGTVDVSVSATDTSNSDGITGNEGWNLLGNPFNTDLSVTEVIDALENANPNVQANIQVWDHDEGGGQGGYVTLEDGDLLAPFQAFFVKYTSDGVSATMTFDKSTMEANTGAEFYKNVAEDAFNFDLELHGEQYFDTYSLAFNDKGTTDLDRYDAYKLFSLNANSINLYSTLNNNRIQKNVLPRDLESTLEIPLSFEAGDRESLTFQWENIENLPSGWKFTLIDKELDKEIDLSSSGKYEFTRIVNKQQQKNSNEETLLNKSNGNDDEESRFVISVQPKQQQLSSNDLPDSIKLNPNYPNPFNPQTTIPYELTEEAEVRLTVWNMIGQKVATLVDGLVEAGTHEETWNASNMPSGMYIARFEVGGKVFTRKMTLIK